MSTYRNLIIATTLFTTGLTAATDVLTGGNVNNRTNSNLSETALRPENVKTGSFGKLFSVAVDGQIYAQPLYLSHLTIPGKGSHNVVYTATMHNTVYAFDADGPGLPLWSVNLGPAVPTDTYASDWGTYVDIAPENGILSTPTIDPNTGTLYVVAATYENQNYIYRLHALDTATGQEKFGSPAVIAASVAGAGDGSIAGAVPFHASQHLQRPGLLLTGGVVYVAFGSHADAAPYHGWIVGYSAMNVQNQTAVFNASPNGSAGAIWQSGRGLAADSEGNIYAVTSNGTTDETSNFSENVLRLDSTLRVRDWFLPYNFDELNASDGDLGACGAVLIDGTNYLVTGGKQGVLYLLDKTRLGNSSSNDSAILSRLDTNGFGIFNMAIWSRPEGPLVYLHTANAPVTAYRIEGGKFTQSPVARSINGFNVPYQGMSLSANGSDLSSGILWVLTSVTYPLPAHGVLRAYTADGLSEIWNSDMQDVDSLGTWVKFANPTIADGKVFVPTGANQLVVFGSTVNAQISAVPVMTSVVNVASYSAGTVAPGEMVAILGANLGPKDLALNSVASGSPMSSAVGGTQVTFNGIPGPVYYSSNGIVAAIVPYAVAADAEVKIKLTYNGLAASEIVLPVGRAAPGIFTADASGSGPGAILNSDYTLNTAENAARPGDFVVLYGTGGGLPATPVIDGALTDAAAPLTEQTAVTVGGQPAEVLYAGNAGGIVAGVIQVNVRIPDGVSGTVPIILATGGVSSQATVTVSVAQTGSSNAIVESDANLR